MIYERNWIFLSSTRMANVLQDLKMDKMQHFMPKCTIQQIICKNGHGIGKQITALNLNLIYQSYEYLYI